MRKIIQIGLILAGIGIASYPWISNSLYEKEAGSRIQVYEKKSRELPKKNYQNLMREARDYNANLAKADVILTDPFSSEQSKKNTGKDYREILHIPGSEVMAYVDIPGIRIYLPVYHGTDGEVLEKGIGHLGATSVPVGGKGTHAVLTGHTGLDKAKLFTDLEEVRKKDQFYIHVLGKVLAYEVDDISVVRPDDTKKLYVQGEQDLVTLLTCTPYGVNSHRLLVRGHRISYRKEAYREEKHKKRKTRWQKEYRKTLLIAASMVVCVGILKRKWTSE